jgi:hypothetical protein
VEPHPLDPVSLLFGLAFVAAALAGLIGVPVDQVPLEWFGPGAVVLLGIWLLATARRDRGPA